MTLTRKTSRLPYVFLLLAALLFAAGCDTLGSEEEPAATGAVYVANQGNFGDGNGSITTYDPQTQAAAHNVFGDDLTGTIIQSINLHDDRLYAMANTGGYVDVFDAEAKAQVAQIPVPNPRYMAVVNDSKAYVTTQLYDRPSQVAVIDLATNTVTDSIEVGGAPDGITVADGRAYVALGAFGQDSTVAVIDTETDAVVDTVDADCDGTRYLFTDAQEEVYVVCTGRAIYDESWNVVGHTDGAVRVLDGATGEIVDKIEVDGPLGAAGPGQDAYYAAAAEEAYVVKKDSTLLRLDTAANAHAATIGPIDAAPIGAVAYDVTQRRLYVGHVPGFDQSGTVTIHRRDGTQVSSFTAGVAPTYITFRPTGE